jgi:hypothetical protein
METRSQHESIAGSGQAEAQAPLWLQRSSLATLVVTCIYLGLMLVLLPWTPYWKENSLFGMLPQRAAYFMQTGAARGLASGLGLLDIWIGISELVQWRGRHGKNRR